MSRSSEIITKLLQCLQTQVEPYGMSLNQAKTKLLVVNGSPSSVVSFTDNTSVHVVEDTESLEYLGMVLDRKRSAQITFTTRQ
jgi:hypothetical protein